jgi:hypothetical protein
MWLDLKYGDTILPPCPSFTKAKGDCHGVAIAGPWSNPDPPYAWTTGFAPHGHFDWSGTQGASRDVSWEVIPSGGYLEGTVPAPNSPNWTITDAGILSDGKPDQGAKWYTPDLSAKGAGEVGGPIYIDYENK